MECASTLERIVQYESAPLSEAGPTGLPSRKFDSILIRDELRERYFGELDAQPLIFYNWVRASIWDRLCVMVLMRSCVLLTDCLVGCLPVYLYKYVSFIDTL